MLNLTIREVATRSKELEQHVNAAINAFIKDTGLVPSIELVEHYVISRDVSAPSIKINVTIHAE